jgi:hypothetical protein
MKKPILCLDLTICEKDRHYETMKIYLRFRLSARGRSNRKRERWRKRIFSWQWSLSKHFIGSKELCRLWRRQTSRIDTHDTDEHRDDLKCYSRDEEVLKSWGSWLVRARLWSGPKPIRTRKRHFAGAQKSGVDWKFRFLTVIGFRHMLKTRMSIFWFVWKLLGTDEERWITLSVVRDDWKRFRQTQWPDMNSGATRIYAKMVKFCNPSSVISQIVTNDQHSKEGNSWCKIRASFLSHSNNS